jgi:hypothetical protein
MPFFDDFESKNAVYTEGSSFLANSVLISVFSNFPDPIILKILVLARDERSFVLFKIKHPQFMEA